MKRVTRAVDLDDLRDLVEAPPRAYLAYNDAGAPAAAPVRCRRDGERWFIALPPLVKLDAGANVALLVDDGHYYGELRGFRIRGRLAPGAPGGERELLPERTVAWHYGAMRRRQP
jgi:hypothetical protein